MVVVIYLQYLCTTEKNIAFIATLVELLRKIWRSNSFFYLRNGFSSQDGLIDHASATKQHNIAWNISIRLILFLLLLCVHHLSGKLVSERNGLSQIFSIAHHVIFWFFMLIAWLYCDNISRKKLIRRFNNPFTIYKNMSLMWSQSHWAVAN